MYLIKYFGIQLILSSVIILASFYFGSYIQMSFTTTDLIATVIAVAIVVVAFNFNKLKNSLKPIRLYNKILTSIGAIFIAALVIGILTGQILF